LITFNSPSGFQIKQKFAIVFVGTCGFHIYQQGEKQLSFVSDMIKLTFTGKKIMEAFRYFRIKRDHYLSVKRVLNRKHLWRDIDDETFTDAMVEPIKRGYIGAGEEYVKRLERREPT
jgi:hypothetical protein